MSASVGALPSGISKLLIKAVRKLFTKRPSSHLTNIPSGSAERFQTP
jgi:hypothetical protein